MTNTIFVRKTACQKYIFSNYFPKSAQIGNFKTGVDVDLWIHDPFLDLPPKNRKIRFWIPKSGFGFPPLTKKKRTVCLLPIKSSKHPVNRCWLSAIKRPKSVNSCVKFEWRSNRFSYDVSHIFNKKISDSKLFMRNLSK